MSAPAPRPGTASPADQDLLLAVVGAGRIGSNHAEIVARRIPGVRLAAVCDVSAEAAKGLAERLGAPVAVSDPEEVLARPEIGGVLVTAPAREHTALVVAAAEAGKHVFVEKPMAVTLHDADRAIRAAERAGTVLQVGFNRRFSPGFAAARAAIDRGDVGTPQLMRSLTRDPGPFTADPARIPAWTIFLETLIHDFDLLCWLNPGAAPVRAHAVADALIRPDARSSGHLDTAVATVVFDNGAIATAEASFSALYGYDVRAEVFGSAGMVTMGDGRSTDMALYGAEGVRIDISRRDTDLMRPAYLAELTAFTEAIRRGAPAPVGGRDARTALATALACIDSVRSGAPVEIAEAAP